MLKASQNWIAMSIEQISASLSREQAYALVDAVMEHEDLALTASAHEDAEAGMWVFEATCESPPNIAAFSNLARRVLGSDIEFAVDPVDSEINWVAKSLEGLAPVVAGGFYVYGSHETSAPPAGVTALKIDAAQAFGTGHHETTTGCLEAIDMVLKRRRPRKPIDIGTGTGVLAIGIAKRLRLPVLATDNDPLAVATSRQNARDNGVGQFIVDIEAEGLASAAIHRQAPFDLIVANILAGPLISLAPGIAGIAGAGATVILSGILDSQASRVINAYATQGMNLVKRIQRKEWTTLVLEMQ